MNAARRVSSTETARILRKRLKAEFPGTKFSVRSERHAGGAAISVHWTDGPLKIDVQSITRQYEGAGYDGLIDIKHQREHWLKSDGTLLVRHDPGTNGSTGTVAATDNRHLDDDMPLDAERVRFAADYILAHRRITDLQQQQHQAEHWVYDHCRIQQASEIRNPARDKTDNQRVTDLAYRIVAHRKDGETLRDGYDRACNVQPPVSPPVATQPAP